MLLLGGLDTVTALLGFVAAYLADHPEQCAEIRARGNQLSSVTEELLRRFAIASIARSAARDFELHGVTLKAGDRVLMPTILYNLDEEKFADPTAVNFDRGRINHLTFGSGTHACIGSYLARTELGIFLEEWLSRIPDFEIPPDKRPKSHSGGIDSLEVLMLRWKS
jgi:cytochrome P450